MKLQKLQIYVISSSKEITFLIIHIKLKVLRYISSFYICYHFLKKLSIVMLYVTRYLDCDKFVKDIRFLLTTLCF